MHVDNGSKNMEPFNRYLYTKSIELERKSVLGNLGSISDIKYKEKKKSLIWRW